MNAVVNARPIDLDIRSLCKHFTLHLRGGTVLNVLEGFSMQARAGECVVLSGPSGRGKSTVLKCLAGNYCATSGQILFRQDDKELDLVKASTQTIINLRRNAISHVSQFLRSIPRVGAREVVAERLLQGLAPMPEEEFVHYQERARRQAEQLLIRLRLPPALWTLPPATFSGGEQQRVNIACGFARNTPVLLLDEPTASLDAVNRQIVIELIREAKVAGKTVVGIFHDEEVRDAVATRLVEVQ